MSLSNKAHLYAGYVVLGMLSTLLYWPVILLIAYHIKVKHLSNTYITLGIALLILCSLWIHTYKEENLSGHVVVVNVKENTYNQTYQVKKGLRTYEFNSQTDYQIGDRLYLEAKILSFRNDTVLFGFNENQYKKNQGVYGKLDISEIKYVDSRFHVNSIKQSLLDLNIPFFDFILNEPLIDDGYQLSYVFGLSSIAYLGLLSIGKKILFYLNLNTKIQKSIIVCMFIIIYLLNQQLTALIFLMMLILELINEFFHLTWTHLDKLSLRFIILVMINPYVIFHQGFILIHLFSFFYQLVDINKKETYLFSLWMMIPFQMLWYQEINLVLLFLGPILFTYIKKYVIYVVLLMALVPYIPVYDLLINGLEYSEFYLNKMMFIIPTHTLSLDVTVLYYLMLLGLYGYGFKHKDIIMTWSLILIQSLLILIRPNFVYFLDVGQGDSSIIYYRGEVMVVDAFNHVEKTLRHLNLRTIDHLILTHSDLDHIKEANTLIENLNVKNIYINANNDYKLKKGRVHAIAKNHLLEIKHFNLKFLAPIHKYQTTNDHSLVFSMVLDENTYLYTGDISKTVEKDLIETYDTLKADVIKVAHHGSNDASSREMIALVNPRYAIISAGENNHYGHPHKETLDNLSNYGIQIYQTNQKGSILHILRRKRIEVYLLNKPDSYW